MGGRQSITALPSADISGVMKKPKSRLTSMPHALPSVFMAQWGVFSTARGSVDAPSTP
jgi:hypothetical protein